MPFLGCVADDFTGASDAASFLVKGGMSVLLTNGIPKTTDCGADAVVIALKSRTQKKEEAVADSIASLKWLEANGAKQFYIKYCSTFDSTPEGNIGPIADAAIEYLNVHYSLLCPGLPVNGRTVSHGELYVYGVPLNESHMKAHPLTPMWDSSIARLMKPQSRYECMELWEEDMLRPDAEIFEKVNSFASTRKHFYIVPDHNGDADAERIVGLFGGLRLLTGGSGILESLAKSISRSGGMKPVHTGGTYGRAILLAGSCSKATLSQINYFLKNGGLGYKIDPAALLQGRESVENIWRFVQENSGETVLVYSSDTDSRVKEAQILGRGTVAAKLEETMSELARLASQSGCTRIIVAGGETSGAVTQGLGFASFKIGESVAMGVPVMTPAEAPEMRLVLKSGNFGQEDFFERALRMTGKEY